MLQLDGCRVGGAELEDQMECVTQSIICLSLLKIKDIWRVGPLLAWALGDGISSPDTIRSILGIIGNVTTFLLFASPIPTIWTIWQNKSVEEFKFHPIVAGIMNCFMWIFYSMPFVHPDSILVTTINSVGLVMYIIFNIIYLINTDKKTRKSMACYYVGEVIFLAALACITMLVFHTTTSRSTFVGIFCDIFGIILYGSPLTM